MTDIGHTGTDENFINLFSGHIREKFNIIRIIRAGKNRLFNCTHINLENRCIIGIVICHEHFRIFKPLLHGLYSPSQSLAVLVSFSNHPFEQNNIRCKKLNNGLLVQLNGAGSCRTFSRGVSKFKCLLHFQVGESFNFNNPTGKNILFALFGNSQHSLLYGAIGNGVNQIPQGYSRLHFSCKPDQNRLRHIKGHDTGCRGKSNET